MTYKDLTGSNMALGGVRLCGLTPFWFVPRLMHEAKQFAAYQGEVSRLQRYSSLLTTGRGRECIVSKCGIRPSCRHEGSPISVNGSIQGRHHVQFFAS